MRKKAVCYARFSSSKQREESIVHQLEKITEYCKTHNLTIVGQYIDEAQSGTTDRRTNFQKMMVDAEAREWDYIVVYKMDRFSRSVSDALHYQKLLKSHGVDILSVIEDFDSETPEGGFFNLITMGMSQLYVQNLRRSVMAGLLQNAKRGMATGGIPPLGYDFDVNMKLIINEYEAETVRIIFDMISRGHSYRKLAHRLNEECRHTKEGGPFKANFHDILKNRKYIGEYVYNRSIPKRSDGKRNTHDSKAEFEIVRLPNAVPRIVDDITFYKVQEILRQREHNHRHPRLKSKYLLTGLLQCEVCGHSPIGNVTAGGRNKTPRLVYVCKNKINTPCHQKDFNMANLDGVVKTFIKKYLLAKNKAPELLIILKKVLEDFRSHSAIKMAQMSNRIEELDKDINVLVSQISDVKRSMERIIIDEIKGLEKERNNLFIQYRALEIDLSNLVKPTLKSIYETIKQANDTLDNEPKNVLRNFIDRIIIGNSGVHMILNSGPFLSTEPLVSKLGFDVSFPHEMVRKVKYVEWEYDYEKIVYKPKKDSKVKLESL